MNPNLLGQAANQHLADLQQRAARYGTAHHRAAARQAAARRTAESDATSGRPATIRNRAGWTLVQIGLSLATSSADA